MSLVREFSIARVFNKNTVAIVALLSASVAMSESKPQAESPQNSCTKTVYSHVGPPGKGYDVAKKVVMPCADTRAGSSK